MARGFVRDKGGAAAVEFGLVAPIIVAVLIGIGTMGGLILAHSKMRQAVSSGAQYAMTVNGDDATAIRDVVLAAWDDRPDGATVTVTKICLCGDVEHSCATNCDDGDYPEKATTIHAARSYTGFGGATHAISARQKVRTW